MGNMSYCRFENTSGDMKDCIYALEDAIEEGLTFDEFLKTLSSEYERDSVRLMASYARRMNDLFEQLGIPA